MVMATKTPQGARLNPQNTLELSQGMSIQVAIDTANAHGGVWTILLYPGSYREGDISHVGVANITIKSMGPERVVIAPTVAPAAGVIVSGAILTLDGVDVIAPTNAFPALRVEGGTCTCLNHCEFRFVGAGGDSIQMVNGILTMYDCLVLTGDIDLRTNACTLNMYYCRINADPIDTAGAFIHNITLVECDFNGQNINSAATGATVITIRGCSNIGALTHAGTGAVTIRDSEVASINMTAAGTVVAYGGYIGAVTRAAGSVVWWLDGETIKVLPSAIITDGMIGYALAAAAAGHITIRLAFGTYEEDNLVGVDNVQITGEGKNYQSQIVITSTNDIFTFGNVTAGIRRVGIIQNGAAECIAINNAGADIILSECRISAQAAQDAVHMTAGSVHIWNCIFVRGDIDLSAAACTLDLEHSDMLDGDIVTAGAFAHTITLVSVDMNNNNITNGATGATTLSLRFCSNILAISDASLLGTVYIEHNHVGTVTKTGTSTWTIDNTHISTALLNSNATGDITVYGGVIFAVTDSTGSIVWYSNEDKTLEVITGMKIAHALAEAGANSIIKIGPGTYAENNLQLTANVDLVGEDPEECQIVADSVGQPILKAVTNVTISNLTVGNINAGNAAIQVNPGNLIILRNCEIYGTAGGECLNLQGGSIYAHETHFSAGVIHCDTQDCTVTLYKCEVTVAFNTSAARDHVLTFVHCDFGGNSLTSGATGATTLSMRGCSNVGTVSNAGTGVFTIVDTDVDTIVAGDLSTVRMKNCSYRAIQRAGTGNIVDESPVLMDAPWHIERWNWQVALANAQVAVRGVPLDAGSGQIIIETLDSGAGVMAVETSPELARALGNEFTPARTPRFLTQISAHTDDGSGVGNPAFDPHVAMFFGLRHTLGPALPAHPEHHAGFIWTGAAFNASSNDGAATQTTALTTPSDDAQHQLEVIVFGGVTTVGWVEFYIDGALVATHVTRIPVDVLDWQHLIIGLGTGGGDTISVTVRPGGCQECPA